MAFISLFMVLSMYGTSMCPSASLEANLFSSFQKTNTPIEICHYNGPEALPKDVCSSPVPPNSGHPRSAAWGNDINDSNVHMSSSNTSNQKYRSVVSECSEFSLSSLYPLLECSRYGYFNMVADRRMLVLIPIMLAAVTIKTLGQIRLLPRNINHDTYIGSRGEVLYRLRGGAPVKRKIARANNRSSVSLEDFKALSRIFVKLWMHGYKMSVVDDILNEAGHGDQTLDDDEVMGALRILKKMADDLGFPFDHDDVMNGDFENQGHDDGRFFQDGVWWWEDEDGDSWYLDRVVDKWRVYDAQDDDDEDEDDDDGDSSDYEEDEVDVCEDSGGDDY